MKREARAGEVWEWWCTWDHHSHETYWHPYLLLEIIRPTFGKAELYNWKAVDLLNGQVVMVSNVPAIGWEKLE